MIGSIRRSRQIMASRSHLQIVTRPAKPKGIDAPVTYRKEGAIVSGGALLTIVRVRLSNISHSWSR